MPSWVQDLANLMGETVHEVPGALNQGLLQPIEHAPQAIGDQLGALGNLIHVDPGSLLTGGGTPTINNPADLLGSALSRGAEIAGAPMQGVQRKIGDLVDLVANTITVNPENTAEINKAYAEDGGRGVWMYLLSKQPLWNQALLTLGTDPTTYLGLGVTADVAIKLGQAAEVAQSPALRLGLRAAQGAVKGADFAYNGPTSKLADLGHATVAGIGKGIDRVAPNLLKPTLQTQYNVARNNLIQHFGTAQSAVNEINQSMGPQMANAAGASQLGLGLPGGSTQLNLLGQQGADLIPDALTEWRFGRLPANAHDQIVTPFHARFLNPDGSAPDWMSALQMPALGEKPGVNVHDVLRKHFGEAVTDFNQASALRDVEGYHPDLPKADRLAIARKYDAQHGTDIAKTISKWDSLSKPGTDPVYGNPLVAAVDAYMPRIAKDLGIKQDPGNLPSLVRGMFGELAFFSPRFHWNNLFGGMAQNALEGVWSAPTAPDVIRGIQLAQEGVENPMTPRAIYEARHQMPAELRVQKFGDTLPPQTLQGGIVRSFSDRQVARSQTGELIGKVGLNTAPARKLGYQVSKPLWMNRLLQMGIETNLRSEPYSVAFENTMRSNFRGIENAAQAAGGRIDLAGWMADQSKTITPTAVYDELISQGVKTGDATHVSRLVAQARNQAKTQGLKLAEKAQYSYNQTNLDAYIRNVVPFHYWLSRSLPRYTEAALRNPALPLAYFHEMKAAEDAQNDPGLDARQKGFIKLFGTPLGYTVLFNPEVLWGVATTFDQPNTYQPDGQTTVGGALQWLKEKGFSSYPWIDGMLNLMGVEGDTFEPDLMPVPQKALFGAVVRWMAAEGHLPAPANIAPGASAMGALRAKFSKLAVEVGAPNWLAQYVPQKAAGSTAQASFQVALENRIISRHTDANGNVDLTYQQLLDATTNPDNPDYQAAYQDMATAGVLQQLTNFVQPVKIRIEDANTDVRKAMGQEISAAAARQGVAPWEFQPTAGDIEFAARYRAMTGRDWKPEDYDNSQFYQDIVNAPTEAKPFIVDDQAYTHLGTAEQQKIYGQYLDLAMGNDARTSGMTPQERQQTAAQWADVNGHTGVINTIYQLQQSFIATHPEYAAYKQWKSQMQQLAASLPGGSLARYRDLASQQDPNARFYFQSKWNWIVANESDPAKRLARLEQATTSAEAWLAITGQAKSRYSQVAAPLQAGAQPGDWAQQQLSSIAQNAPISPDMTWAQVYGFPGAGPTPGPFGPIAP